MALGRPAWKEARSSLQRILSASEGVLRDNQDLQKQVLIPRSHILIHQGEKGGKKVTETGLTIPMCELVASSPNWRLYRLLLLQAARHQCWDYV